MSFREYGEKLADARRQHPAATRNQEPLLPVLSRFFPPDGLILEIASGTGQHAGFFATELPLIRWQPTDHDAEALPSIEAWRLATVPDRIAPPVQLDVRAEVWPVDAADGMLCVNMLQVAPWEAAVGLLRGAARVLVPGGVLIIYSPLSRGGVHISEGNAAFDARLRARNPALGVRDADAVVAAAEAAGLIHVETVDMPANNTVLVFRQPPA